MSYILALNECLNLCNKTYFIHVYVLFLIRKFKYSKFVSQLKSEKGKVIPLQARCSPEGG